MSDSQAELGTCVKRDTLTVMLTKTNDRYRG